MGVDKAWDFAVPEQLASSFQLCPDLGQVDLAFLSLFPERELA